MKILHDDLYLYEFANRLSKRFMTTDPQSVGMSTGYPTTRGNRGLVGRQHRHQGLRSLQRITGGRAIGAGMAALGINGAIYSHGGFSSQFENPKVMDGNDFYKWFINLPLL